MVICTRSTVVAGSINTMYSRGTVVDYIDMYFRGTAAVSRSSGAGWAGGAASVGTLQTPGPGSTRYYLIPKDTNHLIPTN